MSHAIHLPNHRMRYRSYLTPVSNRKRVSLLPMTYAPSIRLIFFILLVGLTGGIALAQADPSSAVLRAERARFEAQVAADTTALRALLHPDLLFIHSNGREESAEDMVASVAAGAIVYQQFEALVASQVVTFGRTALVDGTVRVTGRYEGDAFSVDIRYTSVYRRERGRWLLIRWQSLKV